MLASWILLAVNRVCVGSRVTEVFASVSEAMVKVFCSSRSPTLAASHNLRLRLPRQSEQLSRPCLACVALLYCNLPFGSCWYLSDWMMLAVLVGGLEYAIC